MPPRPCLTLILSVMLCDGQVEVKKVLLQFFFRWWSIPALSTGDIPCSCVALSTGGFSAGVNCSCRQVTLHVPVLSVYKGKTDKNDFVQIQGSSDENQPLHVNFFGKWLKVASFLVLLNSRFLEETLLIWLFFPFIFATRLLYLLLSFKVE